jgi:5-methylthioribose kinase
MDNFVNTQNLDRYANVVICSIVMNLEWLERQLLAHTETVAQTDNDPLLERLFSSQVLILESITKLKIASEVLNSHHQN